MLRHPIRILALVAGLAWAPGCDGEPSTEADADGETGEACSEHEDCADDHDCTTDTCEGGRCRHDSDDAPCVDDDPCNGTERCDALRGCVPGEPVRCDDGIVCTVDECAPETGRCASRPDDGLCGEGFVCDVAAEGCVPG